MIAIAPRFAAASHFPTDSAMPVFVKDAKGTIEYANDRTKSNLFGAKLYRKDWLVEGESAPISGEEAFARIKSLGASASLTISQVQKAVAVQETTRRSVKVYADPTPRGKCSIEAILTELTRDVLAQKQNGVAVYVLPEDFCTSASSETKLFTKAEKEQFEAGLADLARNAGGMLIVPGTLLWKDEKTFRKTAFLVADGAVQTYDKGTYVSGDDKPLSSGESTLGVAKGLVGGKRFTFDGMQCVLHICADAGVVESDADLQIVVANGFGRLPANGVHSKGTSIVVDVDTQLCRVHVGAGKDPTSTSGASVREAQVDVLANRSDGSSSSTPAATLAPSAAASSSSLQT